MVRLKVTRSTGFVRYEREFQFLMVRLKAEGRQKNGLPSMISIPYGSIKSCHIARTGGGLHGFQFLMVRLKDPALNRSLYIWSYFNSLWFD